MEARPTAAVLALEAVALAAAVLVAVVSGSQGDWDPGLFVVLVGIAIASDLTAVETAASGMKISGSFLAIVVAMVLMGAAPAAVIAVASIFAGWMRSRYPAPDLLINLVTYAWFPLLGGIAFKEAVEGLGFTDADPGFYMVVLALFCFALILNFSAIAAYSRYIEGGGFLTRARTGLVPILPSELASALLAVGTVYLYVESGLAAIAMLAIVLLTFQYLLAALLLSQRRAEELDKRTRQLAGFQAALLGALLRTLDLRDHTTAHHSAAVARYSRDLAAEAGLDQEQQDLAHTAGLLHDIGKFVFPDDLLNHEGALGESDWEQIRMHPYEGARLVSEVDGYQPVGEIILAHHERVDGLGYPRGLHGEQIPEIARIVAITDTYDTLTARDSYKRPVSWFEAVEELRAVSGSQLDGRLVGLFEQVLERGDVDYRHGESIDLEVELTLEPLSYLRTRGGGPAEAPRRFR